MTKTKHGRLLLNVFMNLICFYSAMATNGMLGATHARKAPGGNNSQANPLTRTVDRVVCPLFEQIPRARKLSRNVTVWLTTQLVRLFCLRNFFCGLFFALFNGEGSLRSDNVLAHCSSGLFRLTGPDRAINLLMQLQ